MSVYAQVRAGEPKASEPLRSLLTDGTGLNFDLSYVQAWNSDEPRSGVAHRYYIPSVADLVGIPSAAPETQRDLFNLWSLVNLQLDTWHDDLSTPIPSALVQWLGAFSERPDLTTSFDTQAAPPKLGDGFRQRVERIHRFARFRAACPDDKTLEHVTVEVIDARLDPATIKLSDVKTPAVVDLVAAVRPIGAESLPQAEGWLRYVVLLSYRNQGVDAIASKTTGANTYWQNSGMPGTFSDPVFDRRPELPDGATVRWDHRPGLAHFDRAVVDATLATYRFALWRASSGEADTLRFRSVVTRPGDHDMDGLLTLLGAREREIRFVIAAHLRKRTKVRQMAGWASAAERARMEADLFLIARRVGDTKHINGLIRRAYQTRDSAFISAALQGSDGPPGFASWNPNAMPSRTFNELAEELGSASKQLANLTEKFDRGAAPQEGLRGREPRGRGARENLRRLLSSASRSPRRASGSPKCTRKSLTSGSRSPS